MPHIVTGTDAETQVADTGLIALSIAARILGHQADPHQLRHRLALGEETATPRHLLRAARMLGFKARNVTLSSLKSGEVTPPILVRQVDGHWAVLAGLAGEGEEAKVLIHDPQEKRPLTFPVDLFLNNVSGEAILLTKRSKLLGENGKFGLRWFIPAIRKYKRLFSEVLIAAFFLQIMASVQCGTLKGTSRAPQTRQAKAWCAGNRHSLFKRCNAGMACLGDSLRVSHSAPICGVAPT